MAARPKISERELQITKTKQLFLFSVTLKACWFQRSNPRDSTRRPSHDFSSRRKTEKCLFFSGEIICAMKEKVEAKKFVAQSIRLWRSLIRSIKNSPDDEQFTARISSHFLRYRLTRRFPRASYSHLDLCDLRLVDCIANRADFRKIDCSVICHLMTWRIWESLGFDS